MSTPGERILQEAGIRLDKLQEIPLESDPEQQALRRVQAELAQQQMVRWMDLHALQRQFAPVLLQCGNCGEYFPQTKMRYKVVHARDFGGLVGTAGSHSCTACYKLPPATWIENARNRSKRGHHRAA